MSPLSVFGRKKRDKQPLSMVALYDAPSAQIACDAGVDALLIGDSLGNNVLGFDSTIPVTIDDIARHLGAVVRGVKSSTRPNVAIIADLPFGTYATQEKAVENAVRLMQLGAHAVKIEGTFNAATENAFAVFERAGIPVMGHIGFTPQSELRFESIVQGKTAANAKRLLDQAAQLDEAGAFAVVLEAMTRDVAVEITRRHSYSTIGIGAGSDCNGQVLVWHDIIGLSPRSLRFAKSWGDTRSLWNQALQGYVNEVNEGTFPTTEHGWALGAEEKARLDIEIAKQKD